MWCEEERQEKEEYIIVIELRIDENDQGRVFIFKECEMDR